jgi:hypothetical protein
MAAMQALFKKLREGGKLEPFEERMLTETCYNGEIRLPQTPEEIHIANECAKWSFAHKFYQVFSIPVSCDKEWLSVSEVYVEDCTDLTEWLEALDSKNFSDIQAKCKMFIDRFRKGFSELTPEKQEEVRTKVIVRKYPVAQEHLPDDVRVILGLISVD